MKNSFTSLLLFTTAVFSAAFADEHFIDTVTNDTVKKENFWSPESNFDPWFSLDNYYTRDFNNTESLGCDSSNSCYSCNNISSLAKYHNVNLSVETICMPDFHIPTERENDLTERYYYSRGYSFQYYQDDDNFVEFRVIPDDKEVFIHVMDMQSHTGWYNTKYVGKCNFDLRGNLVHCISVTDGKILWKINGIPVLEEKNTSLRSGFLRLKNFNNQTIFVFK